MKTLADFKRALTLGSKWIAYHNEINPLGLREVSRVQSNAVAFKNPETYDDSWLHFPKASLIKCDGNTATIYREDGRVILTYTKIEE